MNGLEARIAIRRSDDFEVRADLSISSGQTVALLGPNAAGKSTLVSALAGLLPIDRGRVSLGDSVLDDPETATFVAPDRRRIGVVFQDYLLFPHLNVVDNVAFGLRSRGVSRSDARSRARDWVARLGLEDVEGRRPAEISGGQAQRVALARALVIEPELLLLDEPLSALDVATRARLRHVVAEHLSHFEGPRLLITHDPTEAFVLADEIHVIENGEVTQKGSADEIRLRPRTQYAADLVGSNLVTGVAAGGAIQVGQHILHVADPAEGPVLLSIHPTAISVHTDLPTGSPRNTWSTRVEQLEIQGPRVRLQTGAPLPLTVELTESARRDLGIERGGEIWLAIKATEIGVQADPGE